MASTPPQRVVVTSDQSLVAEAISAALRGRGLETAVLRWPAASVPGEQVRASLRRGLAAPPDVGLLLSDLDRPARVQGAVRLMSQLAVPWVVLAGAPRGALWGGLLELGAAVVLPASTTLSDVVATLGAVAEGRLRTGSKDRRELTAAWHALQAEQRDLADRMASMTPRETEVLRLLYAGAPVRVIAERLDVSEATVRSQVKRVLRKLDVRSQLAAVAAFEGVVNPAGQTLSESRSPERT